MKTTDSNNSGKMKGAAASIAVHAVLLLLLMFFSIIVHSESTIDETPEKEFIAVELSQPRRINIRTGNDRVTPEKATEKPVQQAHPTVKIADRIRNPKPNNKPDTKAVTAGNEGDVERYEQPQPKINEKALFRSTTTGTEDGHERNKIKDDGLYNGSGTNDSPTRTANTQPGFTTSEKGVSFSLSGRSAAGGLPKPMYKLQKSGKVVVEIQVNQNGVVTSARAIGKGSTVQDATLWKAAEDAARKARFNVDKNAANSQMGTITYIFTLK